MVLALVDDLMFRSKIKSTANRLGLDVTFASSSDAILTAVRAARPVLVILDLNSRRADPIGTVTALKSDPALASIRTIGYVSHVDADTTRAAREAGIDEVVARSAFASRLADLLSTRD